MGEGEVGEATGDQCTTTVSAPVKCTNQDLISTKHRSRPKGRNDGRITSLSHAPKVDIKTFPPPLYRKNRWLYEERVFGNFQNFRKPRFKISEPGFWVFSPPSGKGVNTRTDNLRVHTVGSDTHTTSVGTTALSQYCFYLWGYKCLKVGPTSVILGKFRIMATKQSIRGG